MDNPDDSIDGPYCCGDCLWLEPCESIQTGYCVMFDFHPFLTARACVTFKYNKDENRGT